MPAAPHRHPRSELMPPPVARRVDEPIPFQINPDLDRAALAAAYARDGQARIYGLLSTGAVELYDYLQGADEWIHVINGDDGVLELDMAAKARMPAARWAKIEAEAHRRARHAFQYRYEAIQVPETDGEEDPLDPILQFSRFMRSAPMQELVADVTGHRGVLFTDGQATCYGPGDFLTVHDDAVEGKERLCAFVYGLTPGWRIEWGGLLLFHGDMDRTADAFAPRFNSLDLFAVPRPHSVSLVTPAAPHRRYAITGWLRSAASQA